MFFRTLLHVLFLSRRKPDLGHYDIARTNFITLPTDLDINRHMNNGVYFSIMDVARFDMLVRNGVWRAVPQQGLVPGGRERDDHVPQVAAAVAAVHDRVEARRLRRQGRLHGAALRAPGPRRRARGVRPGFIRARFLSKSGGTVPVSELIAEFGALEGEGIPEWIERWGADVALPATRAAAPSVWH